MTRQSDQSCLYLTKASLKPGAGCLKLSGRPPTFAKPYASHVGNGDRLVHILGFYQITSSELFLRVGERTIVDRDDLLDGRTLLPRTVQRFVSVNQQGLLHNANSPICMNSAATSATIQG